LILYGESLHSDLQLSLIALYAKAICSLISLLQFIIFLQRRVEKLQELQFVDEYGFSLGLGFLIKGIINLIFTVLEVFINTLGHYAFEQIIQKVTLISFYELLV
jgi:hypothetical protein